jgi:DDE superfamily endonuclease
MFKIVAPTPAVTKFLLLLKLNFSKPQQQHLVNFIEALLACEGTKTIAKLNSLILDTTDQSAFTDFFTYSPWDNHELRHAALRSFVHWALQENHGTLIPNALTISIDDSKSPKPKTSLHFEVTSWHFDTTEGRGFEYGVVFLTVHLACGARSVPLALRLYLRQSTVRKLNRDRAKGERLSFKSKLTLVKELLKELAAVIPKNTPVYVLFDSWYASKKLIALCRRLGYQVICALKHNRRFRKTGATKTRRLSHLARYVRTREFKAITVNSSDSSTRYWVHRVRGFLPGIKDEVCIIISKRNQRDNRPEFFLCTEPSLTAREVLSRYTRRWAVEVDHLYLKVHLGLGDFRLRSYEGVSKYFDLVGLALAYLHWRKVEESETDFKTLSDVLARHRQDQNDACLRAFGQLVLQRRSVEQALAMWYQQAA